MQVQRRWRRGLHMQGAAAKVMHWCCRAAVEQTHVQKWRGAKVVQRGCRELRDSNVVENKLCKGGHG